MALSDSEAQPARGWSELLSGPSLPLFALLCLGVWLNAADSLVTATIMPSVAVDIGGYRYFSWAAAGYLLGSIVAGASAGRISERFGLRGALAFSALVYAVGCVVSGIAPGIEPFLVGRLSQGVGAGWLVGLCYVAIRQGFPERQWARMFAALSGVWGVATVLGPLVGGLFANAGHWRWAFYAFAIQACAFAAVTPLLLKPAARAESTGKLALPQLGLLTVGIVLVALGGLAHAPALAAILVVAGLVVVLATVRIDSRARVHLLPREAGDLRSIAGSGYAMIFLLFAAAISYSVYGAALLQALHGVSPLVAGYVISAEAVGWTLCAMLVAGLPRERHSAMIRFGAYLHAIAVAVIAFAVPRGTLLAAALAGGLLGCGFGLFNALTTRRILAALPESEGAIGSAAVPTVQLTGNAVGAATAGVIANLLGFEHGFSPAAARHEGPWLYAAFIPLAVLGLFAAFRVASHRPAAET